LWDLKFSWWWLEIVAILWHVPLYSLVHPHFEGTYCFHLQNHRISQASNRRELCQTSQPRIPEDKYSSADFVCHEGQIYICFKSNFSELICPTTVLILCYNLFWLTWNHASSVINRSCGSMIPTCTFAAASCKNEFLVHNLVVSAHITVILYGQNLINLVTVKADPSETPVQLFLRTNLQSCLNIPNFFSSQHNPLRLLLYVRHWTRGPPCFHKLGYTRFCGNWWIRIFMMKLMEFSVIFFLENFWQ
jgi:hypothetical protein